VFEALPERVGEVGDIYGVKISSLPPGAHSYYDTLGDSVVWSVRYDFGMVRRPPCPPTGVPRS